MAKRNFSITILIVIGLIIVWWMVFTKLGFLENYLDVSFLSPNSKIKERTYVMPRLSKDGKRYEYKSLTVQDIYLNCLRYCNRNLKKDIDCELFCMVIE